MASTYDPSQIVIDMNDPLDQVYRMKHITRLEIIDGEHGRRCINMGKIRGLELQIQDEGRTLKIFIESK